MGRLLVGFAALLAIACDSVSPAPGQLRLQTVGTEFLAGTHAAVEFTNVSPGELRYNECYAVLDRLAFRAWMPVGPAAGDLPCRDILRILAPGASGTVSFPLPIGLQPGTYRYRFTAFADQSGTELPLSERVTPGFTVVGVPSEN